MAKDVTPDLAAFADYDEPECTDPRLQLEVDAFMEADRSRVSSVPGVLMMVKEGLALVLLGTTFPNKGWSDQGKEYRQIQAPEGYTMIILPHATYQVHYEAGRPNKILIDMDRERHGFSIAPDQMRMILAYNQNLSWYHRN